jgi:ABC-2 type transport system permease protein
MKNLIHAELQKLRTTRLIYLMALLAVAYPLLTTVGAIGNAGRVGAGPPLSTAEGLLNVFDSVSSGGIIVLIIGILIMGGEFRHNTATSTFLISPKRGQVVVAKIATSVLVGAVLAAIATVLTLAIALPWLATKHVHVDIFSRNIGLVLLGGIAVMTIYGAIGVGVGSLIRNQGVAVAVALTWVLVVESLLISFAHEIGRWTPTGATSALTSASRTGLLPMWGGAVLLVAYGLVFAAAGTRFTLKRDIF